MWPMILMMSRLSGSHSMFAGRRPEKFGYQQSSVGHAVLTCSHSLHHSVCCRALQFNLTAESDAKEHIRAKLKAVIVRRTFLIPVTSRNTQQGHDKI